MPVLPVPADQNTWWQRWNGSLLLIALLLLALIAIFVLALNTPWVLDQPLLPYDWQVVH